MIEEVIEQEAKPTTDTETIKIIPVTPQSNSTPTETVTPTIATFETLPTVATVVTVATNPNNSDCFSSPPQSTQTQSAQTQSAQTQSAQTQSTHSSSTSRLFSATKSILASTTSTLQSVSSTVHTSTLSATASNTISSLQSTVQKTSAQLSSQTSNVTNSINNNIHNINLSNLQSTTAKKATTVIQELDSIATKTASTTMDTLNSLPSFLRRTYTVPDKAVASQVLMYRQILHTPCKPNLRLSRSYEGTEAQKKVKHMPWWEQGVETSRKMVISYNNLIVRLWLNGAIMPFVDGGYASDHVDVTVPKDDDDDDGDDDENHENKNENQNENQNEVTHQQTKEQQKTQTQQHHINTLIDSSGLPPIPHHYWVDRLGFQQTDPITDFRSGGVLSLAMLVHIVETCPNVHARFLPSGDTYMLPFGITCINITDMIAKFCMFSKNVESMDALLSQKPFWRMFIDPDCLLVLQEVSMEVLCNVVVEMGRERRMPKVVDKVQNSGSNNDGRGDNNFTGQDDTDKVRAYMIVTKKKKHTVLITSCLHVFLHNIIHPYILSIPT